MARQGRNPAVRNPLRPDARAFEAAERALSEHRDVLHDAKVARDATLEDGRDTLRNYKHPLSIAVTNRRAGLEREMNSLHHFDAPLQAAKPSRRRNPVGATGEAVRDRDDPGKQSH